MGTEIVMPKLSDTMEEGKILKWLKHVGDVVAAGDVIAEVETDKADMELEASEGGVLRAIQVGEGESAAVGAVIALFEAEGAPTGARAKSGGDGTAAAGSKTTPLPRDDGDRAQPRPGRSEARKEPHAAPEPSAPPSRPPVKASAAARALASERGIDLATLAGSGPDGRVVSGDVEAASAGRKPARAERSASVDSADDAAPAARSARDREAPVVERYELSRMRQSIARRMSEAAREIPHFAVTAEIDMSEAVRLKAALEKTESPEAPITFTHMVLKATARALTRHPRLNASFRDDALEVHADVNLGMAVAVEDGLIVPVLLAAAARSHAEIAAEARRLVALTKQGRFGRDDLSDATFTVSNMGMLDIESFTAVINPPQAAILAVGSIKPRAVVRNGALAVASTMFVTVSCDHRIIDGVMAGRFLEELKTLLENPIGLVVS